MLENCDCVIMGEWRYGFHILAWHLHEHLAPDLWFEQKHCLNFSSCDAFALMCIILVHNICYDTYKASNLLLLLTSYYAHKYLEHS